MEEVDEFYVHNLITPKIHRILANSPAYKDGRLRKGDRILSINGLSMRGLTHRESVTVLKVNYFELNKISLWFGVYKILLLVTSHRSRHGHYSIRIVENFK